MKKTLLLLIAVLTVVSSAAAQTRRTQTTTTTTTVTTASAANTKAVRAAFDKLIAGIRESDVEIVTGAYQNSPNTLYFNNNGTVTKGWEQDKINREARYPNITNVKLDVRDVRVEMLGNDGAVVSCLWTQSQDYNGTPETAAGRMTLAFKRIGKEYKIVHLHTSPDKPDATRPVFDSERVPTTTTTTTTTTVPPRKP